MADPATPPLSPALVASQPDVSPAVRSPATWPDVAAHFMGVLISDDAHDRRASNQISRNVLNASQQIGAELGHVFVREVQAGSQPNPIEAASMSQLNRSDSQSWSAAMASISSLQASVQAGNAAILQALQGLNAAIVAMVANLARQTPTVSPA